MILIYTPNSLIKDAFMNMFAQASHVQCVQSKDDLIQALPNAHVVCVDDALDVLQDILDKELDIVIFFITSSVLPITHPNVTVVRKPLSAQSLTQQILLTDRLKNTGSTLSFETPSFIFNASLKQLTDKDTGRTISLTEKETDIITYLYQHRDENTTKEQLLMNIFDYKEGVETHTVETHIYKLSKKIGANHRLFLSTEDQGYKLIL